MRMTVDFGVDGFKSNVFGKMLELGIGDEGRLLGFAGFGLELAVDPQK